MIQKVRVLVFLLYTAITCSMGKMAHAQVNNDIRIVGAMKHVMWDGRLEGSIALDTISEKEHLIGLGPVEYLSGEILLYNGRSFVSRATGDSTMLVEETFHVKAPFMGYANISEWQEHQLPDEVRTFSQLESFINNISGDKARPFFFKATGIAENATIHIVNLPRGATVSSPEEAHQGLTKYRLTDEEVIVIGFYSTEHQTILTHHDTYVHLHLITSDYQKMGHLDDINFKPGTARLFLPK